jgi:hypothetical protein
MEYLKGCNEDGRPTYPAVYTVALCYSVDRGDTWTFLGDIVGVNESDTSCGVGCNIGGVPYLVVDGYFYVYYNETQSGTRQRWPSVARAGVADVLYAARRTRVTRWRKYAQGGWYEDGLTGLGSRLFAVPLPGTGVDLHNDAAFCRPLNEYLLTCHMYCPSPPPRDRLYVYRSPDGINWDRGTVLVEAATADRHPTYSFFASLDEQASSDCRSVGGDFYIYYLNMFFEPTKGEHLPMYRVKVTVGGGAGGR